MSIAIMYSRMGNSHRIGSRSHWTHCDTIHTSLLLLVGLSGVLDLLESETAQSQCPVVPRKCDYFLFPKCHIIGDMSFSFS